MNTIIYQPYFTIICSSCRGVGVMNILCCTDVGCGFTSDLRPQSGTPVITHVLMDQLTCLPAQ